MPLSQPVTVNNYRLPSTSVTIIHMRNWEHNRGSKPVKENIH